MAVMEIHSGLTWPVNSEIFLGSNSTRRVWMTVLRPLEFAI